MRTIKIIKEPVEGVTYPNLTDSTIEVTLDQMRQVARKELMFNSDKSALVSYEKGRSELVAEYEKTIQELNDWFASYDLQVSKYLRCQRLGEEYKSKYGTIEELDAQAKINAAEINRLKTEITKLKK